MNHVETAVVPRNVARAVVVKHGDIFFLSEHTAEVPPGNDDGFGLYYHDCRYLNGYELRIAGTRPNALAATSDRGSIAEFAATNEKLYLDPHHPIAEQTFGIGIERILDDAHLAIHDVLTIENYDVHAHQLPLSFAFAAAFEDVFEIRGLHPKKTGRAEPPAWHDRVLLFGYDGADAIHRRLEVHFHPVPDTRSPSGGSFLLHLKPGERRQIKLTFRIVESRKRPAVPDLLHSDTAGVAHASDCHRHDWLAKYVAVESDSPLLNQVMQRSLLDLGILRSSLHDHEYFSAGLPWYGTLFGRDSIIAALQTLAYEPAIAEQTIRLLAKYQGSKTDDWRDEQPGKILHELRMGELANLNEIPQTPYYGSVDSTPLFLILIGEHANWTGDLALFREIRANVERALAWIDHYGEKGVDGYLSYATKSRKGLGNQGWKDSGDSVMNADGSLATQPIALVEVQGYVYRAKLLIADLYARSGDSVTADRLRREAAGLRSQFDRDFWVGEKDFYAIALQKGGRPAAVISSNPGQALWSGIVDDAHAAAVVRHLTSEHMFSGWGIRTLSTEERRFNPVGYHLGTVWPHDNALIAAGFRRYGFDREALSVLQAITEAASYFGHFRLPEVFAGYSRAQFHVPVRYPVACHPQAWAAGSVPFMVATMLGITADAFHGRLRLVRPALPNGVNELDLRRLKIAGSTVDLHFHRASGDVVEVDVARRTGDIEVDLEPAAPPRAA